MADRRDTQYEERERWRDNPNRSQDWGPRYEREPRHSGQWEQNEGYGDRERNLQNRGWEESAGQRFRNEEEWARRGERDYRGEREYGPRQSNQGAADYGEYRDRPYSGSGSYVGHGGYAGHIDPYVQGRERGFGATSTGTGWGNSEIGRHRLGSLTESAAASAENVIGSRYGETASRQNPSRLSYAGRGPKGYRRSDDRVREEVCELLTRNPDVDATNIEVAVHEGIVVLAGSVEDRRSKRIAEDIAQDVSGARDVQNQIRVDESGALHPTGTTHAAATGQQGSSAAAGQSGSGGILGLGGSGTK